MHANSSEVNVLLAAHSHCAQQIMMNENGVIILPEKKNQKEIEL